MIGLGETKGSPEGRSPSVIFNGPVGSAWTLNNGPGVKWIGCNPQIPESRRPLTIVTQKVWYREAAPRRVDRRWVVADQCLTG